MSAPPPQNRAPFGAMMDGLRRLPDLRAALEALALFLLIMLAGAGAMAQGALVLRPSIGGDQIAALSISLFLVPALAEELVFRGWLKPGQVVPAAISLAAFVAWHPLQLALNLPLARPQFAEPVFLMLAAGLGLACTLTRMRSGSIWPGVIIHWGTAVVWVALFAGRA